MPVIQCPVGDCTYETDDINAGVAAALLILHNNTHIAANQHAPAVVKQKPPKLDRPKVSKGSSEETWRAFQTRWTMFKDGTQFHSGNKATTVHVL